MSILRRYPRKGNVYFITNVTFNRPPILVEHIDLLWQALQGTQAASPFVLSAWVILPDHLHLIINPNGGDLSVLLQRMKMSFAALYRKRLGLHSGRTWQHRFWDHILRDQEDMNRHIDYVHFNPVKHGLVGSPFD